MEERRCLNCFYSKPIFAMTDRLCKFNGIVDKDDICRKYQFDYFEKRPAKKRNLKEHTEEEFSIEEKK